MIKSEIPVDAGLYIIFNQDSFGINSMLFIANSLPSYWLRWSRNTPGGHKNVYVFNGEHFDKGVHIGEGRYISY